MKRSSLRFALLAVAGGPLAGLLLAGSSAAATGQLVVNPGVELGTSVPNCFQRAGFGTNTSSAGFSTDAHSGTRAWRMAMTARTTGDRKLLTSEAAGCSPAVTPGLTYDVSVWYRSTSTANALSVYRETATGWQFWKELARPQPTAAWTQVRVTTPVVPAGTTRLSFGMGLAAPGVLLTDDYALTASAPATGTLSTQGRWTTLSSPLPSRTIHTTLLRNGKVLLIAGSGNDPAQFAAGTFTAQVWDPLAGTFTTLVVPQDMFCSGHVTLADGRVLIMGGTKSFPDATTGTDFTGLASSWVFDPATNAFTQVDDAQTGHWYPTLTRLGNGDVWAAGGLNERGTGATNTETWSAAQGRWLTQNEVTQTWNYWGTYPHMILLRDGRLFYSGAHTFGQNTPGTGSSLYDIASGVIQDVPGLRMPQTRDQAGSTLLPPAQDQRVAIFGGGDTINNATGISLTDVIDLKAAAPAYHAAPDMPGLGKAYVNTVVLPDRTVLTTGGAQHNRADPVRTSALFEPRTETWTAVADNPVPRAYHSSAVLLPDGRVVTLGGNPADGSFELRVSVYEPPYLFKGARPALSAVPTTARLGSALSVGVTGATGVAHVDLTAPMSVTHQTDPNMRLVDVPFTRPTSGSLALTLPADPDVLPPGPYMLTVTNAAGVPSVARWVLVTA